MARARARDVVFGVILGTGVGGGIVVDGGVLDGRNGIAGEWGHNPLPWPRDDERPGAPCYCGRRGCIETLRLGPGLRARSSRGDGQRRRARANRRRTPRRRRRVRGVARSATRSGSRARSRMSSTCSTRTSSCWAAACRTCERLYDDVPRLWARVDLFRPRRHEARAQRARRLERRARRRAAVARAGIRSQRSGNRGAWLNRVISAAHSAPGEVVADVTAALNAPPRCPESAKRI